MTVEFNTTDQEIIGKLDSVTSVMKDLKISLDIDGVEVHSAEKAIENLNRKLGTTHIVSDLVDYWAMVNLVAQADGSIKEPKQFAIKIWNDESVFGSSNPVSGAWILSNYLNRQGIRPIRVTSRPSAMKEVTHNWYRTRMPWVDDESIFVQDGDVHDVNFKMNKIKELGIDLHFEDSVEEAEAIVSNTKARVVLVPQVWNRNYKNPKRGIIIPSARFNWHAPKMVAVYLDLFGRI